MTDAKVRGAVSKFPPCTNSITDMKCAISVKGVWAGKEAAPIQISISPIGASGNTYKVDVIYVIIGEAATDTSPIINHVLPKISTRTYILAHFYVWVCICKHLYAGVSWAVVGAYHIQRITIISRGTESSVDTIACRIKECILWACSHTLILYTIESIVNVVVNWTGGNACPV